MLPYIGFPINKSCPLRCQYCGPGAEAAISTKSDVELEDLKERVSIALEEGFTKFRLTGGEPLLHPKIGEILLFFSNIPAITTLNTAAFLIEKKRIIFNGLGINLKVICSLDSLKEERFNKITQTKKYFPSTIKGIEILAEMKLLKRLNMMVIQENQDEVSEMISYCRTLGCDLKVSDIAQAPDQFDDWDKTHITLKDIESKLANEANSFEKHPYSQYMGIPCFIYNINGVKVTVKSSYNGTTYSLSGNCTKCKHFPCEEGHYFINSLPDNSLSACRMNGYTISPSTNFRQDINKIKKMFKNIEYFNAYK